MLILAPKPSTIPYFVSMKFFCCTLTLSFLSISLFAQTVKTEKTTPFKPPVVVTSLGDHKNGDSVSVGEAARLLSNPVMVNDLQGKPLSIVSYGFRYKKMSFAQNPEDGKFQKMFTTVAGRFEAPVLPVIWVSSLKDELKPEEEFYYFDVMVKDNQGRKFYAPDLKLYLK